MATAAAPVGGRLRQVRGEQPGPEQREAPAPVGNGDSAA
jgi:hypothetical protein